MEFGTAPRMVQAQCAILLQFWCWHSKMWQRQASQFTWFTAMTSVGQVIDDKWRANNRFSSGFLLKIEAPLHRVEMYRRHHGTNVGTDM